MPRHDSELSDDAKQELAAIFADMKRRHGGGQIDLGGRPVWLNDYDRPHLRRGMR